MAVSAQAPSLPGAGYLFFYQPGDLDLCSYDSWMTSLPDMWEGSTVQDRMASQEPLLCLLGLRASVGGAHAALMPQANLGGQSPAARYLQSSGRGVAPGACPPPSALLPPATVPALTAHTVHRLGFESRRAGPLALMM